MRWHSPISGIVTKRSVTEGQYIKEGDALLEIADLSTVETDLEDIFLQLTRRGPSGE